MIKLIILAIISLVNLSCVDYFRCTTYLYEIKNETGYDIKISFYEKSTLKDEINIKKNNKFSKLIKDCNSQELPIEANPDSVIILIDNKKYIEQYCDGKHLFGNFGVCYFEKNFIDQASWKESKNGFKRIRTIILNNSDYEKAIPL